MIRVVIFYCQVSFEVCIIVLIYVENLYKLKELEYFNIFLNNIFKVCMCYFRVIVEVIEQFLCVYGGFGGYYFLYDVF